MNKSINKKIKGMAVITLAAILCITMSFQSFALVSRTSTTVVKKQKTENTNKEKSTTKKDNKKDSKKDSKKAAKKKDNTPKNILNKNKEYVLDNIDDDVFIVSSGVSLSDTTINGDLFIEKSVGNGNIKLYNVVINGNIYISGGGSAPITIEDSTCEEIFVDNIKSNIKVDVIGSTHGKKLNISSNAVVHVKDLLEETAFDEVSLEGNSKRNLKVSLSGNYKEIEISSDDINFKHSSGKIDKLIFDNSSYKTFIELDKTSTVGSVNIDSSIKLSGEGKFENIEVSNKGVLLDIKGGLHCDKLYIGGKSKSSVILLSQDCKINNLTVQGSANIAGKGSVVNAIIEGASTDFDILGATIVDNMEVKNSAYKASVNLANNAIVKNIEVHANAEIIGEGTVESASIASDCTIRVPVVFCRGNDKYNVKDLKIIGNSSDANSKWVILEVERPYTSKANPRANARVIYNGGYLLSYGVEFDNQEIVKTDVGIVVINKSILQKNRITVKIDGVSHNVVISYLNI